MDIDIERLKTDAAYWDEVAPEDATHWCTLHNKWVYNPDWYDECCIPLPTKPAAPEWDGYVDADDNAQEWDGLAIEVVNGRISSITIPEGLENGVIRVSKRAVEIH